MSEENKLIDIKGRAFLMNNGSDSVSIQVSENYQYGDDLYVRMEIVNRGEVVNFVNDISFEEDFHEVLGKYQKLADAVAHVGNGIVQYGQKKFPHLFENKETNQETEVTAEEEEYVETLKPTTIPLYQPN